MSANPPGSAAFGAAVVPVPRSWGKPRIILPEHAPDVDIATAVAKEAKARTAADKRLIDDKFDYYMRASTLCKALNSGEGLIRWKAAMTLMGAAKSPTIIKAAKVLTDWKGAEELVEKCVTLAGGGDAATEGTTLHKLTEFIDTGQPLPDDLDPATLASLASYRLATYGLRTISAETFVVNDDLRSAGTFDRLVEVPDADPWPDWLRGRRPVADLKTGSLHVQSHAIQLAVYARGQLYDARDGSRTPLGADLSVGLVMHMPQGEGRTDIYAIDIEAGWLAAQTARWAKNWNTAASRDAVAHLVASVTPEQVSA